MYPKNYWKKCPLNCAKLKAKNGCAKKWNQVLTGACKRNVPKWHLSRNVNQYCKKTCNKCGKMILRLDYIILLEIITEN